MLYDKKSSKISNALFTSTYHEDSVSAQYLGLKNLINEHFLSLRLVEFQVLYGLLFLVAISFLSYLLSFIVLATFLEFNPLNTFVGSYNFDSTTNYQFNPYLLTLLLLFFAIALVILFAQLILSFDIAKAKLSDSIMNTAIEVIQDKTDTIKNKFTDTELRKYFIEKKATKIQLNFNNVIAITLFALTSVFLIMIWILIKS